MSSPSSDVDVAPTSRCVRPAVHVPVVVFAPSVFASQVPAEASSETVTDACPARVSCESSFAPAATATSLPDNRMFPDTPVDAAVSRLPPAAIVRTETTPVFETVTMSASTSKSLPDSATVPVTITVSSPSSSPVSFTVSEPRTPSPSDVISSVSSPSSMSILIDAAPRENETLSIEPSVARRRRLAEFTGSASRTRALSPLVASMTTSVTESASVIGSSPA